MPEIAQEFFFSSLITRACLSALYRGISDEPGTQKAA